MNMIIKAKNKILTDVYKAYIKIGFRLKVMYEDPSMKEKPVQGIYICNHMAHLDGFLIRTVFSNQKIYSLVTSEWYEKSWAKALLFYEQCIPINRNDPGTEWIHQSRAAFEEGASVNIFPEGHTSKSENMNEFYPGFLMLASFVKNIPIIPVATIGDYKFLFGKGKKVLVGKPIAFDRTKFSLEPDKLADYAEEFRNVIKEMQERLRENE